jgi:ribosome-dependent ATPase
LVWEPAWEGKLTPEERNLLKLANKLRIDAVHRAGVDPVVEWEEIAITELLSGSFDLERQHPAYGMHRSSNPGFPPPTAKAMRPAERRARIDELLKATGLDPFPDRPCGKLSGGMKQKVSLCCSLMHDPDLLVLDEPTTGVDPLSRRQFWELVDSIRARRPQMSVMVATAYMDEASRFDWLAAMDDGKVIAHGAAKDILAKAQKTTLDDAFIALLPPEKRGQHQEVIVRPRVEAEDKTPAIEADGLTRRFGDFVAVDHVSFRIERGEIFGFLGSNGCGKTTTMKMMTGLLPVTEGSAKLFGKPMGADDMEARQNVGYMSQAFSFLAQPGAFSFFLDAGARKLI